MARPVCLALLAVAFVAAGCGARWSDDQQAAVVARYAEGGGGGAAIATAGNSGTSSANVSSVGSAATSQGSSATAASGTGSSSGPGAVEASGGQTPGSSTFPCAASSDAPGVTDTEITLGSISSLSGPVPGLGAAAQAAAQAYVEYRNSIGGVCGRQLVLRAGDDGTDNGRYRAILSELDSQVLAVVGGFGAGDAGGADVAEQRQIPIATTAISEAMQNVSTVFDINPPFADVHAVIGKYRYLYEAGARRAAVVYIAADMTRSEIIDKQIPQMQAAGIEVVLQSELPLSTLSYDAAARAVANSGADYLLFLADATLSASMARSMADTDHQLRFAEYIQGYGQPFLDITGPAGEGAISWIRNVPSEEPGTNAEQDQFLAWMAQTAPDMPTDSVAVDSWAGTKAIVDALEALSGPISREALIAQLHTMNTYDAGGLLGPIQLGNKLNNGCFIAMQVIGGAWRRMTPEQGFLC